MRNGQDINTVRRLSDIKSSVQVMLYTTNNNKIKQYMSENGIEGSLRAKATWLAIEEHINNRHRQNNTHHVDRIVTRSNEEYFADELSRLGLTEEEVLAVYGTIEAFLDAIIFQGDNVVLEVLFPEQTEPEYEVITTETTESVYTFNSPDQSEEIAEEEFNHQADSFIREANTLACQDWEVDEYISFQVQVFLDNHDWLGYWNWVQHRVSNTKEIRSLMDKYPVLT